MCMKHESSMKQLSSLEIQKMFLLLQQPAHALDGSVLPAGLLYLYIQADKQELATDAIPCCSFWRE